MPPKRRGRPPKTRNGPDLDAGIAGIRDTSDSSVVMAPKNPTTRTKKGAGKGKGKGKAPVKRSVVPDVYQEMLAEALPSQADVPERPLKRRRTGPRDAPYGVASSSPRQADEDDGDEELEFEDVLAEPVKTQQTAYRDSDEDSEDDEEVELAGVDFESLPRNGETSGGGDLELTLTANKAEAQRPKISTRRRVVSKAERVTRLEIHRMHILCLLSHVERRNDWCNDSDVQKSLRPLLDKKMMTFLSPKSDMSQFGRAESVKRGLEQAGIMWRKKYRVTARGVRKALWADDEKDLQNYNLPDDVEFPIEKSDFRTAAKSLKGSRDLGAQLYCALLRSAGLEVRLVCSLQPLSFSAGGPAMPKSAPRAPKPPSPETSESEEEAVNIQSFIPSFGPGPSAAGLPISPRRRLGHPNAADYNMPEIRAPVRPPPRPKKKVIQESPFPIYWVEVLDEAHQKWLPVDPLVTETIAKPRAFEPPGADRENNMSYVICFEDEGNAKDITRRYAKAYNSKTRKNRIESTHGGDKWWRKTMSKFSPPWNTDLDQIENTELATAEAREPMPKNIQDFKDHPTYALERHLRRNEILVATREVGKVAAGRDAGTPGGKRLENVYRRRDVKIARSADAWYRLGRDVKMGEQPVKTIPAKGRGDEEMDMDLGGEVDERPGTNLYTEEQTELYEAPPVVNGRVPKNSFGNIDVYVPSMVPKGAAHLSYDEASRAARILGIDYADALTGFEFRGRHGTAVLKGIIVASEFREAVEEVIQGFRHERDREREEARSLAALRMWKRFLVGLKIKARVDGYAIDGEGDGSVQDESEASDVYVPDDYDDGGGFIPDDDDDDEGGGFIPE
ncbi:DNA repair protein rhp41 [Lachnellula cervina]|uniref:DNA repair protein rhp41 n=1 Tax=Lachnellula cervina TaxID=1316786 RepID=A0A7D8UTB6_9HELO|nr:DNA repair protein rhp41 [Lachnellula cervina]